MVAATRRGGGRQVRGPAGRLLVRWPRAVRAARCRRRPAVSHAGRVMTDGGVGPRSHAGHSGRRSRGDAAERELAASRRQDGGLHCGEVQIVMGKDAHLRFVNLQNWGHGTWHFAHQKAILDRDASLAVDHRRDGQPVVESQSTRRIGRRGRQLPGERRDVHRRQAAHRLQHAAAPHGPIASSDFLYKGALQDKSRTVWRGMIKVDPSRPADGRLSAKRQPAAQRQCSGRLDSRPGNRGR